MGQTGKFLAFDLGASSGRAFVGLVGPEHVRMEEVHRFANEPVQVRGTLYWDVLALFGHLQQSLRRYVDGYGPRVDGIGVDTWGVDFGLLGADGALLGNPVHYRDGRTEGMMEQVFRRISRQRIYQITGIQFLPFNSLYQLMAVQERCPWLLQAARTLLFMPDLFHYFLTGRCVSEYTIASTSQLIDARSRGWSEEVLRALGLSRGLMPELIEPATVLGPLDAAIAGQVGLRSAVVIAPACHDTASAVAAVPAEARSDWAYLSSGTWSLMGVEVDGPIITEQSLADNFTNEAGIGGTIRFLKNISGLWLLQQCMRIWQQGGRKIELERLIEQARQAEAFGSLIDPDHQDFIAPADMVQAVSAFCRRTGQRQPDSPAEVARCIFESLALACARTLERLRRNTGRRIEVLHIVGGGARNRLLCQLTADACGLTVVAGPAEATALGNILVQALGRGLLSSVEQLRQVCRASVELKRYEPHETERWQEQLERFSRLAASAGD